MYPDIHWILAALMVAAGFFALAKGADVFVDGARDVATRFGVPPFIVGMVVIGFGTSAPELIVSVISGVTGHSNLSLGNAYGSDIFNILAIIGLVALVKPVAVPPSVAFAAAPILVLTAVLSCGLLCFGGAFSRADGLILLGVFAVLLPLYCRFFGRDGDGGKRADGNPSASAKRAAVFLGIGLAALAGGAHILVWGSVVLARAMGVSELMIGLTVVAVGTSLPELAAAVASARKGENSFVLGNIVGSNFFNTLAVVGVAGSVTPFRDVGKYVLLRDFPVLVAASLSLLAFGANWRRPRSPGRIGRAVGIVWLAAFLGYLAVMIVQETSVR